LKRVSDGEDEEKELGEGEDFREEEAAASTRALPCPSCGRDVYADAERCPSCGDYVTPLAGAAARRKAPWVWIGLGLAAAVLALWILSR
jgi:hypothetical protein